MARSIATVYGTAIVPGVSRNGRLYTKDLIAKAVERAQPRLAAGDMALTEDAEGKPLSQRTHHAADDDSTKIVGRIRSLTVDETGAARFAADIADTDAGRTILDLIDTSDGQPAFLRGVSIRGAWLGPVQRRMFEGRTVETADDLELDGLDYTANPGVPGAQVERVERAKTSSPKETAAERVLIYESVQEAVVESTPESVETTTDPEPAVEELGAPALKSGKPAAPQTKAKAYADPGYQDDKAKRYALDTKDQAKAAWSYINMPKNAKLYTANQLKRVKARIVKALRKFGVKVDAEEHWLIDSGVVTESVLTEYYPSEGAGSFRIELNNGPVCVTVSSYCIDPADLDIIGRAAMGAACDSLKSLDPDMDGDIDVPGADDEDTDNDTPETTAPPADAVVETTIDPETPATTPAADTTETKESVVPDETTTPAAEQQPSAAVPAAPPSVTLSNEQFAQLLAAATAPRAAAAPAPVAAESVPAAPAATTETAAAPAPAAPAVTESEEDRINRLVEARMAAVRQQVIQDVVEQVGPPARKGVQRPVTETGAPTGLPEDWPQKPLHQYTEEERDNLFGDALLGYVLGDRANLR